MAFKLYALFCSGDCILIEGKLGSGVSGSGGRGLKLANVKSTNWNSTMADIASVEMKATANTFNHVHQ
jgi:hypothetical protein